MSHKKVELAKRVVDAYNRRDVDTLFGELATPDFEWWPALTRAYEGGCYRGREGIERFAADTREHWDELQTVPEEFRDLGDCVLVLGRQVGRGKRQRRSGRCANSEHPRLSGWQDVAFPGVFDPVEALRAAGPEDG